MSWLRLIRFRLRAVFRKHTLDADMDEEMRLHLELRAERNQATGMSADEAHHAAHRSFGGVEQLKEKARERRGTLWFEQTAQDLRFAVRQLMKTPGFTFVAVLSLAIGIGLNTAVFSIINTIFYQTIRGVPEPKRVLIFNDGGASADGFTRLREEAAPVAAISASRGTAAILSIGGLDRRDRVALVAENYFDVLDVKPALGRLFSSDAPGSPRENAPVAVLNHAFWRRHLDSNPHVLSQIARINGASFTIIGIAAPDFHGPGPEGPPLWIPLRWASLIEPATTSAESQRLGLIGRLRENVALSHAQAAFDVIVARSPDIFGEKTRYRLSAGREDWRGAESPEKRVEFLLVTTVPLIVVAGLLWIACSNVANLLLARAVQRQKEMAIRVASGASRGRLVRMLMGEGLLLALLGGAGGIWISGLTLDFIFGTLSNFSAISVQVDSRVLLYTTAVSVVAALLFALAPALQASRTDVNSALKGESANPALRGSRLRGFFLVSQIASSVALLVVAGTFIKSLVASSYVGPHARLLDHLVYAQVPPADRNGAERELFYQAAREKVLAVPGVESATLLEQGDPKRRNFSRPGELPRAANEPAFELGVQRIDTSYFAVVGANLRRGRTFPPTPPAAKAVREAIVNEPMVRRFWPTDDVVGQRFELDGQPFEAIGVVSDGASQPTAYLHRPTDGRERFALLVRTRGSAETHLAGIGAALRTLSTGVDSPIVMAFRDVAFGSLSEIARLAGFIGALALALASAGIYASMAFATNQRTREIGIRMALGSTRTGVLGLVLRDGFKVVACGSAIGLALALVGLRLLSGMAFAQSRIDAIAIFAVLLVFAAIAGLACLLPARRATRVDPTVALRCE